MARESLADSYLMKRPKDRQNIIYRNYPYMEGIISGYRSSLMKEKYYEDSKENAAFLRHVDVVTNMILKYGSALKRKWAREALFNTVWLDCFSRRQQSRGMWHILAIISTQMGVSDALLKFL